VNVVSPIQPRPPDVAIFHLSRYQHGTNQTNDQYQEYVNVALFGPDCQAFPSSSVLYREQVTDADFRVQIASQTLETNRRSPDNCPFRLMILKSMARFRFARYCP
jgi:hypothetical protein